MLDNDIVVQIARCSFDAHIVQILGSIMLGATVLMLHPSGVLDFEYLLRQLQEKQVTLMDAVPSFWIAFLEYLLNNASVEGWKYLRSVISAGMLIVFICRRYNVTKKV